jgi:hypothetical protein
MFPAACREWCHNPNGHTWANFKIVFAEAHQDLLDLQSTSRQSSYHDVNSMLLDANANETEQHYTAKAIANLATATASSRATVASLSATNSTLTAKLSTTTTKLSLAHAVNAALKIELATLQAGRINDHRTTPANASQTYQTNNNYCWTHRYKVNSRHTSSSCLKPASGH